MSQKLRCKSKGQEGVDFSSTGRGKGMKIRINDPEECFDVVKTPNVRYSAWRYLFVVDLFPSLEVEINQS